MFEMLNEVLLLYCIMLVHYVTAFGVLMNAGVLGTWVCVFDIILNHQMSFTVRS